MIYKQQWKQKVTPSGIAYWAHTASARRTLDKDYIGWRTPKANETEESVESVMARRELMRQRGDRKTGNLFNLSQEAQITAWPTPSARDYKSNQASESFHQKRLEMTRGKTPPEVAGWASPTSTDANRGVKPPRPHDTGIPLTQQVGLIAGWATPVAEPANGSPEAFIERKKKSIAKVTKVVSQEPLLTQREIAKKAGVSNGTVNRVLQEME